MFQDVQQPRLDKRLVSFVDPGSFEAEQYLRLLCQIESLGGKRARRVIAVTSAEVSAGKTLTAINLAGALTRDNAGRVLLVDADLRRPSLTRQLGLDSAHHGLVAALGSDGPLAQFVQKLEGTNVSVLTCQACGAGAYEALKSPRLADLIGEARDQYAYVIVDTPPIIPVPDSAILRRLIDGYIVVVAACSTPRKLLGEALNLLEPKSVIGLVFNKDDRPLFGYYRSHYRNYFRS
jgi:capsular exopolysaccharide synthesis family protein